MSDINTEVGNGYLSKDLGEYQARLTKLMLEESPAIFANYSRAHAHCIIRTFFESAIDSISVLAGDFGNKFYGLYDIRQALVKAIRNGACVRVVSLCTREESVAVVNKLKNELNALRTEDASVKGTFEVKFATVKPGSQVKHYMVIDNKRYRLEDIHTDHIESPVHAEVCCNGPSKAAALNLSFNAVWERLS